MVQSQEVNAKLLTRTSPTIAHYRHNAVTTCCPLSREKTLPGVEDDAQAEKRRMMMEEQEAEEWAYREKQIEK